MTFFFILELTTNAAELDIIFDRIRDRYNRYCIVRVVVVLDTTYDVDLSFLIIYSYTRN